MRTVQLIVQFVCYSRAYSAPQPWARLCAALSLSSQSKYTQHNTRIECLQHLQRVEKAEGLHASVWVHNACIMRGVARILCFIARAPRLCMFSGGEAAQASLYSIPLSALHRITTEALVLKIVKHACAIFKLRALGYYFILCAGTENGWDPKTQLSPRIIHFVSQTTTFYHLCLS
jgi:hypothetical protein